jgi:hypothetical protein
MAAESEHGRSCTPPYSSRHLRTSAFAAQHRIRRTSVAPRLLGSCRFFRNMHAMARCCTPHHCEPQSNQPSSFAPAVLGTSIRSSVMRCRHDQNQDYAPPSHIDYAKRDRRDAGHRVRRGPPMNRAPAPCVAPMVHPGRRISSRIKRSLMVIGTRHGLPPLSLDDTSTTMSRASNGGRRSFQKRLDPLGKRAAIRRVRLQRLRGCRRPSRMLTAGGFEWQLSVRRGRHGTLYFEMSCHGTYRTGSMVVSLNHDLVVQHRPSRPGEYTAQLQAGREAIYLRWAILSHQPDDRAQGKCWCSLALPLGYLYPVARPLLFKV